MPGYIPEKAQALAEKRPFSGISASFPATAEFVRNLMAQAENRMAAEYYLQTGLFFYGTTYCLASIGTHLRINFSIFSLIQIFVGYSYTGKLNSSYYTLFHTILSSQQITAIF